MQSKPRSNSVVTHTILAANLIEFNVLGVGPIRFDVSKVAEQNRERAMLHGFVQRISDRAAISRDPLTGQPATASDKHAAMKALVEYYETGAPEWTTRVAGATSGGLLFQCLREAYPEQSPEAIRTKMDKWSKSEQVAVLNSKKIKPIADRLRAEGGKGVDAEALLESF